MLVRAQPSPGSRPWSCWTQTSGAGTIFAGIVNPRCDGFPAQLSSMHLSPASSARVALAIVAPGAPVLAPAVVSGDTVTLNWTPAANDAATSYVLEAGSASGLSDLANTDTGSSLTTLTATSVPGGTYFVRVRARNASGTSAPSNEIVVVVAGACTTPPQSPTALAGHVALSNSGLVVSLTWQVPASGCAPTSYIVEAGSGPGLANLARVTTGNADTTFFAGRVAPGLYYVRVRSVNNAGTSGPSNEVQVLVGVQSCTAPPSAPAGLVANVAGSTVVLEWGAAGGAPTSYTIEAGSSPGLSDLANVDTLVIAASYTATAAAGTYYVRVRAKNACGTSAPSNEVVVVVGNASPCQPPGAPTRLTGSLDGTTLRLVWFAPAGAAPTSYVIEAGSASGLSDLANFDTGSAATSYTATNVMIGRIHIRVRAKNGCGAGVPSNEVVTTVGGGTVFRMTAAGSVTTLHTFAPNEASGPSRLVEANDGILYGTARAGGAFDYGSVFAVTSAGGVRMLHSFSPGSDGFFPAAALVQGRDGDLYGTTERGGAFDRGTVFRITASGALTILHSFAGIDGESPDGPVVQGRDGNFYGTTFFGGAADQGTIYRMTPSGTVTVRYSFTGGADGAVPTGAIIEAADGSLYGTTFGGGDFSVGLGGGTVFRLSPSGVFTTVHAFHGGNDGIYPFDGVALGSDGSIYGGSDVTLFRVAPDGSSFTTLRVFTYSVEGDELSLATTAADGNLYLTTTEGGLFGVFGGTALRVPPSGASAAVLHNFSGNADGGRPLGGIIQARDGNFYGTTADGGAGFGATRVASPSTIAAARIAARRTAAERHRQ